MSSLTSKNFTLADHAVCAICGQGHTSTVSQLRSVEHNNVNGNVSFCFTTCDYCGSETVNQEQSLWNRREINRFRKRVDHVPLGTQIRAMRKRANLTQAEAGALLGGGSVAFSKYENDDIIPDEAMANLLRLTIADPSIVKKLQTIKDEYITVTSSAIGHWTNATSEVDESEVDHISQFSGARQNINTDQIENSWQLITQQ